MLKPYGIASEAIRDEEGVHRGYRWNDLWPVFERYLADAEVVPT
jgi:hypothetical protein